MRSSRGSLLACLLLAITAALALVSPALAANAHYDATVMADSPLGYWKLDDASTSSAADSSGNNFPMTGVGAMTAGVTGPMSGSTGFAFNGGTLSRGYSNYTDNFAVELWARSDRAGEREAVFSNGSVNSSDGCWRGFIVGADTGNASAFDAGTCNNAFATWGPAWTSTTDWHYIVAQRTNGTTALYVDGNLIGTDNHSILLTGGTVRIGGYQDPRKSGGIGSATDSFGPFKGAIADVAWYSHTLSTAQINAHYNAAFGPPTNTTAPSISLSRIIGPGVTLRAKTGTWVGAGITYTYQWRRCDSNGDNCADIDGATGSTYTLTDDDTATSTIRVRVSATDSEGTGTPASSAIAAQAADSQTLYSEAVMDAGPLAYWKLDDASTSSAADSSGNNFPMTGVGAMTAGVTGPMSGSTGFAFNGGTLSRGYSNYTDNFAVELWARSDRAGEREALFSNGSVNSSDGCWRGFIVGADTGNASAFDAGTCNNAFATWGPAWTSTTDWHYIVAQRTNGTTALYVDGNLIGTDNHSILLTDGTARIGGYQDPRKAGGIGSATDSFGPFKGAIADVAWYSHTLSTAQINAHYNAGRGVPANGVRPTITPATAPHVDDTLTAHDGTWAGDAPLSYTYQWQSCATSTTCTAITGATQSTYTPVSADVGKTIKVVVTATNALGSTSAGSGQTGTVRIAVPRNTDAPAITGDTEDGVTLTSTAGTWTSDGPVDYARQWRRCDASGDGCADIAGATGETYTSTRFDIDHTLRVVVTATNDGGSATATSSATGVVRAAPPANDSLPVVTGVPALGGTFTATSGTWTGTVPITYAYQWQRCDASGDGCADIDGATDDSYVTTAADDQQTLRVVVTATNAGGTAAATSAATAVTDAVAPVLTLSGDLPFWSGHQLPSAGDYALDFSATDAAGSGVVRIQVLIDGTSVDDLTQGCPDGGCSLAGGVVISTDDYADGVHTARVTATDAAGNQTTHQVTWRNPATGTVGVSAPAASPSVLLAGAPVPQADSAF